MLSQIRWLEGDRVTKKASFLRLLITHASLWQRGRVLNRNSLKCWASVELVEVLGHFLNLSVVMLLDLLNEAGVLG
jgi:hypothetical protein